MCRHNQLWGYLTLAFGFGILVGLWLEGGFLAYCAALGLLVVGFGIIRRK